MQAKKTDTQVQDDVIDELRWDAHVNGTDVGVEVHEGVVTLSGSVDNYPARLAAQDAAHRVEGVLDVANGITVNLPESRQRTDTDIALAVRHALEWDVLVPHERVTSSVQNGLVTLEGDVESWKQNVAVSRAVRNLTGVREVRNFIAIRPEHPPLKPAAIRAAIEAALERHAEHSARHVNIRVDNDTQTVVLSGMSPSWSEREAVVGVVRGTRGVGSVDNQIVVGRA